jgi:NDP-sugar pyrophosphorylase family protein
MNIVIPMAGLGSRFAEAGFSIPKPLIPVNGEAMISKAVKSLNLQGQYHFILSENNYTKQIIEVLESIVKLPNFLVIDYVTNGPASSVHLVDKHINNSEELVVANCDQIMTWNSKAFLHNAKLYDGCLVTYHSDTIKNSYARLNNQGLVTEVREKQVISNVSLNGIHYWKQGRYFCDSYEAMVFNNDRAPNGEFYVGPSYNYMIKDNKTVGIYHIPNEQHHPVGVPDDLETYLKYENSKL